VARENIVVVGGYGHVGQVVSTTLGERFLGRVLAAGRDFEKAEAFSLKTDRRVYRPGSTLPTRGRLRPLSARRVS
jgi:saccharopine dehydrogenase-like NADP-dependent oxidoreductase